MLDKLKTFIQNASDQATFDPSEFNDPVAEKTEWLPLKGGGTNMKSHNLKEVNQNRLEYKMSAGSQIFSSLFIIVGIAAGIMMTSDVLFGEAPFVFSQYWPAFLFSGIFCGVGFYMLFSGSKPIVFDKMSGFFWKGKEEPNVSMREEEMKDACRLSSIHAIQILRERVHGDKKSYYSYEINLVKKNGERLNVVDYGKHQHIQSDAKRISEFLGKPVWDAS